ncbi:hypothetical protein ERJ75_000486400 [Trypanosoma vivax]|nr:hypothetical protein ERJ75_001105900 [Trypanosoma vivax]KAH8616368.1 hypothetical protein ERJ75_000486100 [Trypanosoma vivax]KAH8616370.1 hypothetical protein ERJ75_000486200 [Trypanosoma vivax]KAH8616371.1 hypothetical protein ERJ75_000486000 [Trypanosoma vivax]KAH8616372.1 hypothetical protein ERJ75_000486400 [Trypanosoma vivax]
MFASGTRVARRCPHEAARPLPDTPWAARLALSSAGCRRDLPLRGEGGRACVTAVESTPPGLGPRREKRLRADAKPWAAVCAANTHCSALAGAARRLQCVAARRRIDKHNCKEGAQCAIQKCRICRVQRRLWCRQPRTLFVGKRADRVNAA